ncbi:MAG: glycosyltransferase family 2 protein [Deltaproteobacteria bacterium]|nr:glycosyltransferase family 2 protein [Deltaproteobacteria bacterium]
MPEISVVVPTYNRSAFLRRAVFSILYQSFQDYEIIIIDDASTDTTEQEVRSTFGIELESKKILYCKNPSNLERAKSRNKGMDLARGTYIALLDDDDIWLPEHLETLHTFLINTPGTDIVFSGWQYYESKTGSSRTFLSGVPTGTGTLYRDLLLKALIGYPSTAMFKKGLIATVGTFNERLKLREDWEFFSRCAFHSDTGFINKPTVRIYGHEGSYSGSREKWVTDTEKAWHMILQTAACLNVAIDKSIVTERSLRLSRAFLSTGNFRAAKLYLLDAFRHAPSSIFKAIAIENMFKLLIGKNLYLRYKR